jgi:hypothetical protein
MPVWGPFPELYIVEEGGIEENLSIQLVAPIKDLMLILKDAGEGIPAILDAQCWLDPRELGGGEIRQGGMAKKELGVSGAQMSTHYKHQPGARHERRKGRRDEEAISR